MSKSHTHRCWVRAGNRVSLKHLVRWVKARCDYESIQAQEFCCVSCGELWDVEDMTGDPDLDTISCSNCYSNKVYVRSVTVEEFEP